jgi:hypothetical protein
MIQACNTCNDTGEYEVDGWWYVCMNCDSALRGKADPNTGSARKLCTHAEMDKLRTENAALRKALADVLGGALHALALETAAPAD